MEDSVFCTYHQHKDMGQVRKQKKGSEKTLAKLKICDLRRCLFELSNLRCISFTPSARCILQLTKGGQVA